MLFTRIIHTRKNSFPFSSRSYSRMIRFSYYLLTLSPLLYFLVLLDRDFVLNWHVSDDKKSTRPFCRVSGTEGGEEDTGCTHQTPSLATLFNPLTPLLLPLYLPIVLYACVITKGKWAVQYTTALYHGRIFFFFDSYYSPFLSEDLFNKSFWKF